MAEKKSSGKARPADTRPPLDYLDLLKYLPKPITFTMEPDTSGHPVTDTSVMPKDRDAVRRAFLRKYGL